MDLVQQEEGLNQGLKLSECFMAIAFDTNKFVASLPGALCIGDVSVMNDCATFVAKKHFFVEERRLGEFMKLLQCLSKNLVLEEEHEMEKESFQCGNKKIGNKKIIKITQCTLQCQTDVSVLNFHFDISTFLSLLISIRKVCLWTVAPTKLQYEIMDFFSRHTINKSIGFPKINQMEEEIRSVLKEHELSKETNFVLSHFLLNHHSLLEFQYNLICLTTKK